MTSTGERMSMPLADEILEQTHVESHFVQLFEADGRVLARNVGKYFADGLALGGGLIMVATDEHRQAFFHELERRGFQPSRLEREGRITCLNSSETLARFMVDGHPDADRFDRAVGEMVRVAVERAGDRGVRAYGDMVGLLWGERQFPAAIRLEQLWNRLRKTVKFSLFCAYPVDIFGGEFDGGVLDALLCAHTHLLPSGVDGQLDSAVNRAMNEVLGTKDDQSYASLGEVQNVWATLPKSEAALLWVRNNAPEKAEEILALARKYYQTD
jgi:MEDS: MEthanogen/methylotroph, DcmR Sensory domain